MKGLIVVTGGARSGKSRFAQSVAEKNSGPLLYVAAAESADPEMKERILRHREHRGPRWRTLEEPLAIPDRLPGEAAGAEAVLFDCLTIWLSNLLHRFDKDPERVLERVDDLLAVVSDLSVPMVLVTNEVGGGIVPDNPLARTFRDLAGQANQRVAAAAEEVWMVVSGLPLRLK